MTMLPGCSTANVKNLNVAPGIDFFGITLYQSCTPAAIGGGTALLGSGGGDNGPSSVPAIVDPTNPPRCGGTQV
ncbi:MAG: hypothetical protein JNJ75_17580 [Cyclobacteriaceae bacterium]|nr:hypothetical protein [Cyclobacteriaceae bacterium]